MRKMNGGWGRTVVWGFCLSVLCTDVAGQNGTPVEACGRIAFESARFEWDRQTGESTLVVSGSMPETPVTVRLRPLVYVTRPRWWHVEVVGCPPEADQQGRGRYELRFENAERITGHEGVELVGLVRRLKVPDPARGESTGG